MLNDYRRALIGCLGLLALSFVLIGCGNKDADAVGAGSTTSAGAAGGVAGAGAQAQSTPQNTSGVSKGSAIAGPRADPAPKGVEAGNFQGGLK